MVAKNIFYIPHERVSVFWLYYNMYIVSDRAHYLFSFPGDLYSTHLTEHRYMIRQSPRQFRCNGAAAETGSARSFGLRALVPYTV